jgi:hypothetical protein
MKTTIYEIINVVNMSSSSIFKNTGGYYGKSSQCSFNFKSMNVGDRLAISVEGESNFNYGVAVVLFNISLYQIMSYISNGFIVFYLGYGIYIRIYRRDNSGFNIWKSKKGFNPSLYHNNPAPY